MNPVLRLVVAIMATLVLAGAFFFGLVVLMVIMTVFSLCVLFLYLRSCWLGRATVAKAGAVSDGKVIDVEYTVVSRRRN